MKIFKKSFFYFFLVVLLIAPAVAYQPVAADISHSAGLPVIGKWMITPDLKSANWLGQKYQGKEMREPINVIIVDQQAKSIAAAKQNLVVACTMAGYPARWGHSTGYKGYFNGQLAEQLPPGKRQAFSNAIFAVNNSHGRVFGPYFSDHKYYFIAAFSRELVNWFKIREIHQFGSFVQARDDFAQKLDQKTDFKLTGFIDLANNLPAESKLTTGDHDGRAVFLQN